MYTHGAHHLYPKAIQGRYSHAGVKCACLSINQMARYSPKDNAIWLEPSWRFIRRRMERTRMDDQNRAARRTTLASRGAEGPDETQDDVPKSLTFLTSCFAIMPPLLWYVPQSRTQASRIGLFLSPCARWHTRTASCAKLITESVVNVISSCSPSTAFPTGIGDGWLDESSEGRREVN